MKTEEQTEKTITLFKDEQHHQKVTKEISEQASLQQAFVNEFKALELGDLEGQQLMNLFNATETVAVELFKQKQIVPAGFDANKYFDMLVKPDLSGLQRSRNELSQLHYDLFFVENWQVKTNEAIAESLKAANDIILTKSEQSNYNKLLKVKEILEEFGMLKRDSATNNLGDVKMNQTGLRLNAYTGEFVFDLQSTKRFLQTLIRS